jgi:hypothetical protein
MAIPGSHRPKVDSYTNSRVVAGMVDECPVSKIAGISFLAMR